MAQVHDWHRFDVEAGLDLRQVTGEGRPNRWQVRNGAGDVKELDDEQFKRFRDQRLAFEDL